MPQSRERKDSILKKLLILDFILLRVLFRRLEEITAYAAMTDFFSPGFANFKFRLKLIKINK